MEKEKTKEDEKDEDVQKEEKTALMKGPLCRKNWSPSWVDNQLGEDASPQLDKGTDEVSPPGESKAPEEEKDKKRKQKKPKESPMKLAAKASKRVVDNVKKNLAEQFEKMAEDKDKKPKAKAKARQARALDLTQLDTQLN